MTIAIFILLFVAACVFGVWVYKKIAKSTVVDRMLDGDKTPTKAVVEAKNALNTVDVEAQKSAREAKRLATAADKANDFLVETGQKKEKRQRRTRSETY